MALVEIPEPTVGVILYIIDSHNTEVIVNKYEHELCLKKKTFANFVRNECISNRVHLLICFHIMRIIL